MFSEDTRGFYSFHINGELLAEASDSTDYLITPCVGRDTAFNHFVVYFRNADCMMGMRKTPFLERRMPQKKRDVTCFAMLDNQRLVIVGDSQGQFALVGDPKCLVGS